MMLSGSPQSISLIEATLTKKGAELELLFIMKKTTSQNLPKIFFNNNRQNYC